MSDDEQSAVVRIVNEGDPAVLVALNPENTYGMFEVPGGATCWVWMGVMRGPTAPATECRVPVADPSAKKPVDTRHPPAATPTVELRIFTRTPTPLQCSPNLDKRACLAAGGTWIRERCSCPR